VVRIAHTLRPQCGFVQRLSSALAPPLIVLVIATSAQAATVATFVAVKSGDSLTVSNPQSGLVSGQIRLVPDASTAARPPVPFSLPALGTQTFPNVLAGFGSVSSPAILAVESSDAINVSSAVVPVAYPERHLTLPVRFNPSTPALGSLVLGTLNGLIRVNIYEHATSVTPLITRTFGSSGEEVTRLRYVDLLPSGVAISDGHATVTPLSGQAVAITENPPTRRRSVGRGNVLSANNDCGTGSVEGDYAVSAACTSPHIDSFTNSGAVCAGGSAQLT
jgi:hypothetical protein